jgi:hypothetical protein
MKKIIAAMLTTSCLALTLAPAFAIKAAPTKESTAKTKHVKVSPKPSVKSKSAAAEKPAK